MDAPAKSLKSASLKDIEAAIAQALSQLTAFPPRVEIRAFQIVEESALDVLTQENYRFELKVVVPKRDPSKGLFDFE